MNQEEGRVAFQWFSPLGWSVIMFLLSGFLYVLIGVLTPFMMESEFGRRILMMSSRTDTAFFGADPSTVLGRSPDMVRLRETLGGFMGGVLTCIGLYIIALAWFGLRNHLMWSYVTLTVVSLLILPFWYLSFRPYLNAGITFSFADLPPIFWIPAALVLPAAILGWIDLR